MLRRGVLGLLLACGAVVLAPVTSVVGAVATGRDAAVFTVRLGADDGGDRREHHGSAGQQ